MSIKSSSMFAGFNAKPASSSLRRFEVQKVIVQHTPSALTVIMKWERVGILMPPLVVYFTCQTW